MTTQVINLDIYRRSVVIFDTYSDVEIADYLSNREIDHTELIGDIRAVDWGNTEAITIERSGDLYIVSKRPMTLPTLCHELSHVALWIMKTVGIDPIESEEAYAYLYEYLITQVTTSDDALLPLSSDVTSHTEKSQTCPTRHCD